MNFCVLEYTSSIQLNNPKVEISAANGRMDAVSGGKPRHSEVILESSECRT